jgi:glucokinase
VQNPQITETSSSWKNKASFLGIDLGGTKLSASIIVGTQCVGERKQVPTPHGAQKIADAIVDLIEEFRSDCLLAGVGIATAGIVDPHTGQVVGSTGNLPGWEGTPIKKIIEQKTMLPVHVENDANAAAYGECKAAKLQDLACIVAITLGSCIVARTLRRARAGTSKSRWTTNVYAPVDYGTAGRLTEAAVDCWQLPR